MDSSLGETPSYATWIRTSKLRTFWTLTVVLGVGATFLALFLHPLLGLLGLAALPFAYIAVVISWTAHAFSPQGADIQAKIHQLILDAAPRSGRQLDVGCGSGHLTIQLAKQTPDEVVGIDFWGDDWEYSQAQCERNARLEGAPNVRFHKASASQLPFGDATFDAVVSCLTFHEVQDVERKVDGLVEALRVLKPGGSFVFFDLFDDPAYYPSHEELLAALQHEGCLILRNENVANLLALGFPLNTGKVLKFARILAGTKHPKKA